MHRFVTASIAALALAVTASVADAAVLQYGGTLTGTTEVPPTGSPGTGTALVTIDTAGNTMSVDVTFSGLTSGTTASHIHCCTTTPFSGSANVATQVPTFAGFPLGVTSGTYHQVFDLTLASTYNPAFVTANGGSVSASEAALLAGLAAGESYLNVHTTQFPTGEVRAFLTAVPEPATWALMIGGFGLVGLAMRRRRLALVAA